MAAEQSHEEHNRELWNRISPDYQAAHGPQLDASGGAAWGLWQVPEDELQILGDVRNRDVLELGCGAAQWSIALLARGARPTGLDISEVQLEHARELMRRAGVDFPLVCASAEATPFDDGAFDIVFCDWGAMTFSDPYRSVPEVARVLRAGGLFAFSAGTPIADLAWSVTDDSVSGRLERDYWDLYRLEAPGEPVEFQLPYGEWIRLFTDCGLRVESLIELRPAADALSSYRDKAARDWARRWPMEHIWRLRRQG